MLFVDILEPTYSFPALDVREGDFVYAIIKVEYNETNVTDLEINNFTVNIGTELASINDVDYNVATGYYTLNITIPSNLEGSRQDLWVNVTYKGIWKTDINIEAVWYYSPITTTTPVTTLEPSPSPGSSPPSPPPKVSNFTIDTNLINVVLKPGETDKILIKVSNTGETKLTIIGIIQNLDEFFSFLEIGTEYTFELDAGEIKELEIDFTAKEDQEPGVYPGKIIFTSDSIERVTSVILEIESENPLFDVKVEVLPENKTIYSGGTVMAIMTFYNLGKIGTVNAELEYGIKSIDGKNITVKNETLAFETELSTIKSIDLPTDIKPGSYVFYAKMSYNDIVGTGSSTFEVIEERKIGFYTVLILMLIILVIAIIFFIYFFMKKYSGEWNKLYKKWQSRRF